MRVLSSVVVVVAGWSDERIQEVAITPPVDRSWGLVASLRFGESAVAEDLLVSHCRCAFRLRHRHHRTSGEHSVDAIYPMLDNRATRPRAG
jgi:hypothetical protein